MWRGEAPRSRCPPAFICCNTIQSAQNLYPSLCQEMPKARHDNPYAEGLALWNAFCILDLSSSCKLYANGVQTCRVLCNRSSSRLTRQSAGEQVTSLMVSEDERAESTNVFTVLNATDAEGNNSGKL